MVEKGVSPNQFRDHQNVFEIVAEIKLSINARNQRMRITARAKRASRTDERKRTPPNARSETNAAANAAKREVQTELTQFG